MPGPRGARPPRRAASIFGMSSAHSSLARCKAALAIALIAAGLGGAAPRLSCRPRPSRTGSSSRTTPAMATTPTTRPRAPNVRAGRRCSEAAPPCSTATPRRVSRSTRASRSRGAGRFKHTRPIPRTIRGARGRSKRSGLPGAALGPLSALPRRHECDGEDRRRVARRPVGQRIDGVELDEPASEPEGTGSLCRGHSRRTDRAS